jgi:hypothetical protein
MILSESVAKHRAQRTAWLKDAMSFLENSDAVVEVVDDGTTSTQNVR